MSRMQAEKHALEMAKDHGEKCLWCSQMAKEKVQEWTTVPLTVIRTALQSWSICPSRSSFWIINNHWLLSDLHSSFWMFFVVVYSHFILVCPPYEDPMRFLGREQGILHVEQQTDKIRSKKGERKVADCDVGTLYELPRFIPVAMWPSRQASSILLTLRSLKNASCPC